MKTLKPGERARLRQFIIDHLSLDELKNIAFDLGVNYEQLAHNKIGELARELITHLENRDHQLDHLIAEIVELHPGSGLAQLLASQPPCETSTVQELETDENEQLKAKRNELLIARRVMEKQQKENDTPGYKIIEQKKLIIELEKEIQMLEEKQAAG